MSESYHVWQAECESVVLPSFHLRAAPYALLMGFGERLTQARKALGLTQSDLGKGLGTDGADVGKQVVYGWEKDQHHPRVDQLMLICKKLNVSADWLLFGAAAASTNPRFAAAQAAVSMLSEEEKLAFFAAIQGPLASDLQVEEKIPARKAKPATNADKVLNKLKFATSPVKAAHKKKA